MKVILFHPLNSTNTGDKIILLGTENLLREAFGDVEFIYQGFPDHLVEVESQEEFNYQRYDADLFIVSGTPWFWEACHRSGKYIELSRVVELYADMKKVGLGLGACYPITTNTFSNFIYPNMDSMENGNGDWRFFDIRRIRDTFGKFNLLFTRDPVAQELLKTAGMESYHVACPAAFAHVQTDGSKNKNLLIFQNPMASISKESCDREFARQHMEFQLRLAEKYEMEIITASPLDSDCLRDDWNYGPENKISGKPYSTWIRDLKELFSLLSQCRLVVSSRVHEAIPARVAGALTYILPIDTRYLTAAELGVLPVWTYGYPLDLLELEHSDLERINRFTQQQISKSKALIVESLRKLAE